MTKYALVLEGGGAKGAYQVGAYNALIESGYEFNAVIGTSIGAINAALIAQGDVRLLEEVWRNIKFEDFLEVDDNKIQDLIGNKNISKDNILEITKLTKDAIKSFGIKIDRERELLEKYIDEEKVRKSKIRFGLVTFNVSDFKAEKLFIEDIPEGKLIDYLLASSNLPVFKRAKIEDKLFIDGGATDNCSVEMLYDDGYKDIVAIRLFQRNRIRNYYSLKKKKDLRLKMIVPSVNLPYILNFENNTMNHLIDYGYIDAIRQINKLDGIFYAINPIKKDTIDKSIQCIKPLQAFEIVKYTKVKISIGENIIDILINKAIPKLSKSISQYKSKMLKNQILDILEYVASKEKISEYEIYDYKRLLKLTQASIKNKQISNLSEIDKAAYYLVSLL